MQSELVIALVIGIPIILFPAAFTWYLNFGWIFFHVREAVQERKVARKKAPRER